MGNPAEYEQKSTNIKGTKTVRPREIGSANTIHLKVITWGMLEERRKKNHRLKISQVVSLKLNRSILIYDLP